MKLNNLKITFARFHYKKISFKILGGAQKLFMTIWWYAVEKRLGTPEIDEPN